MKKTSKTKKEDSKQKNTLIKVGKTATKKITSKVAKPKAVKKSAVKKAVAKAAKAIQPKPKVAVAAAKPEKAAERIIPVKTRVAPAPPITIEEKPTVKIAPPVVEVVQRPQQVQKVVKEAPIAVGTKTKPIPRPVEKPQPIPKPVEKPVPVIPAPQPVAVRELKEIELQLPVTVKDVAIKLQEKPSVIIKALMDMGVMAGINQILEEAVAVKLCEKYGCKIKKAPDEEELVLCIHRQTDAPDKLRPRPPIVTLMGHVDHGKTSLLDAIRKTKVVDTEHGGITQHIGAYRVKLEHGDITFLDTPGHEAFTAMRARGASVTDIVVLVVAADDGVMPQTEEAIDHARAAGVSIIAAINKIDKPQADLERVKKQLAKLELNPEDWGGKTITVPVSAKTGEGINNLLEMILLEAQMLELKANPNKPSRGVVIEAKMSKGRGPVATLLVHNGTLRLNENIIVGQYYGKVRAMFDDHGHSVTEASPSFAVEVLGISGIPEAGEQFFVLADEKDAKGLMEKRQEKLRQQQMRVVKRISLEDLHAQIKEGKIKELKLIIKADVQGSLEAIRETINKIPVSEIKIEVIHQGVGIVNSSDVILAAASNALILGFNVNADERAKEIMDKEGVELRIYNIIYELANDIKAAVEGMLEPKEKKVFLGRAEVRKVFKLSRSGTVAGCFVTKGKINRNSAVNLLRNGEVVFEGKLSSLKRFKDDVRDVGEGFECGMALSGFDNLQEGDVIEAFTIEKIARKL